MNKKLVSGGVWNPDTLARGQCWQVLIKKGSIETIVKVLDFDDRMVVLRSVDNIDLIARYKRKDVEFLRQIDP